MSITSALLGWKGYAVVAAASLALGASGTWRVMSWAEGAAKTATANAEVKQVGSVVTQTQKAGAAVAQVSQVAAAASLHSAEVTAANLRKVTHYVDHQADAHCVVPVGAVRLLDAAAAGAPVPELAGAAGGSDSAASGAALSDVVAHDVTVSGIDGQKDIQITKWHAWYLAEKSIYNAALPKLNNK